MVLGLRSKNRKAAAVQLDYIIHLLEIKPWPPSQSLKSLRSVVLQWEGSDRNSGSSRPVAPSPGEGRIEFNESFKLHVTLSKEASGRSSDSGPFQKNVLEFNLYEPRRDKTAKGQLLGSAAIDLAEHGIVKEALTVSAPVNSKRSFRNTAQPVLYVRIQPYDKEDSTSSSRESLSKEASMDRDGKESVSALMTEEYAEESEIASFTDDDVSSQSSLNHSSSALEAAAADSPIRSKQTHAENVPEAVKGSGGVGSVGINLPSEYLLAKPELEPVMKVSTSNGAEVYQNGSLPESSTSELSVDPESLDISDASLSSSPQTSSTLILEESDTPGIHSPSLTCESTKVELETKVSKTEETVEKDGLLQEVQEKMEDCKGEENAIENHTKKENGISVIRDTVESSDTELQKEKLDLATTAEPKPNIVEDEKPQESRDGSDEVASSHGAHDMFVEGNIERKQIENGSEEKTGDGENHAIEIECLTNSHDNHSAVSVARMVHTPVIRQHSYLQSAIRKPLSSDMTTFNRRILLEKGNGTLTSDGLKNMNFSMRSTPDSLGSITYATNDQYMEDVKEIDVQEDVHNGGISSITDYSVDDQESTNLSSDKVKHGSRFNRNSSNNEVRELERKVEMLEGELREAAAIEIGLYSIVAEHGSSAHKVHTPARRLSRLYIHASKQWSRERRASTARSAVSGLVLAAKSCGNDVPRLTFWLSNSVVLRAIITRSIGHSDLPNSACPYPTANGSGVVPKKKTSPLKWDSPRKKEKFSFTEDFDGWEDPYTFMAALERVEGSIFSRIIESIWWQTLTPHMQLINEDGESKVGSHLKKNYARTPSLGDQQQANSSIEIWKKAFNDACERLCPVRAGGHECGCLPMLARLVMEQCVARLDVAMFNAILRESDDEIPTDPVSDPISDSKVLPISSGKLSFGAGAQLKNVIGNWSRWLTDLFGMDVDDSPQDETEQDDGRLDVAEPFKSFHLLNALSDLLMLPKDMLLERSIRKEVCPTFGALMIERILNSFLPDDFCPDPIPDAVLEALNSEDPLESSKEGIRNFPCDASPILYSPPSIASIESIIGDVRSASLLRSGSSVVRKCHTSDDELDELDSPLASIVINKSSTPIAKSKGNGGASAVRYQLLREVWRDDN